jgi:hypothetical protein
VKIDSVPATNSLPVFFEGDDVDLSTELAVSFSGLMPPVQACSCP